jgi:glycosyltransferase involved in cell wall biosynthesis
VVVALQPPDQELPYPFEVAHRIRRDELSDYMKVAETLNNKVDAVSIQHDFATWGGPDGAYVLDFIAALDVPAITTLHELPARPTPSQRAILSRLVDVSAKTVVMCHPAQTALMDDYGLAESRIEVIPHGVSELPNVAASSVKASLGVAGREVILTVGLLSPEKGHEDVIDAMAAVVAARPTATYVILGATKPELVSREGEAYRQSLVARAAGLRLGDAVRVVEHYRGRVELTRWLQAADVVVTPYRELDRVVSSSLSYAMGAGRAIVSTPFAYARDLLSDDRGVLVQAGRPAALGKAIISLLADDIRRTEIGDRAYQRARTMTWTSVGNDYRRLFQQAASMAKVPAA